MRPRVYVGLTVIAFFSFFAYSSFQSAVTPYVTFLEAREMGGKVQVMGYLTEPGEAGYAREGGHLEFYLEDHQGTREFIKYRGARPANFEEAESMVVIGSFADKGEYFQAERILVKCPSKYEEGDL